MCVCFTVHHCIKRTEQIYSLCFTATSQRSKRIFIHEQGILLFALRSVLTHSYRNAGQWYKPTSSGGKRSASTNFPPQLSMLVKAMAMGLPGWSNSSAAMNHEMGPGPSS